MKRSILQFTLSLFVILACLTPSIAQDSMSKTLMIDKPVMTFDKKFIDIGTVKKGETRTTFF